MSAPVTIAAAAAIRAGSLSPVALAQDCLARIRAHDGALDSFVLLTEERAMADARRAEQEIAAGQYRGPLHGIPYGLKDIIDTAGIRTTCHSRVHLDRVPEEDSEVAARLAAAGGVLLGKLATHEFATGGPAFDLPFPPARNPWNTACFTGGSSSGSGAAVAAGFMPLALGTDTGGSIRLPAAYCGLAGLKATYGLVSRRGVAPLSFSLDHIGPMTWTIEDCAIALQVLAGHDPLDAGSARIAVPDYVAALAGGVAGMRIGYCRDFHAEGADPEMVAGLDAAMAVMAKLGAEIVEITLPSLRVFNACIRAISGAECFSIHEQTLRNTPDLYARVTRERLTIGGYVSGADYVQAQRLKRQLTDTVEAMFGGLDAIACAAIATPAPRIEDVETGPWRNNPPITAPFNITGQPALSQCCGYSSAGLPLAIQWVGGLFQEAKVLRIAQAYEQATDWRSQRPALTVHAIAAQ